MKTLKCDVCEHEVTAQTFTDWMTARMPHYKEAHADVMQEQSRPEDRKAKMAAWMQENQARFDAV